MNRYWKAVLAALPLVVLVITEISQAVDNGNADGTFSSSDLIAVVVAALTPILVWAKANTTSDPVVAAAESVVLVGPQVKQV